MLMMHQNSANSMNLKGSDVSEKGKNAACERSIVSKNGTIVSQ
jgi:hypothetical protein